MYSATKCKSYATKRIGSICSRTTFWYQYLALRKFEQRAPLLTPDSQELQLCKGTNHQATPIPVPRLPIPDQLSFNFRFRLGFPIKPISFIKVEFKSFLKTKCVFLNNSSTEYV